MESTARVSVVMPCYNAARFLEKTLQSVFAQTYRSFEVVAVDDRSTDETAAILQRYPVKLIRHTVNKGQAGALNTAIAQVRGDYVAFIDADDLWSPQKLKRCVEELDANAHAALVYTNGTVIDGNGQTKWSLLPPGHRVPDASGMLLNCVISCSSQVVARRSALGSFTEGLLSNDHDQWVRMRERGPFIYIDEPLSHYRNHEGQDSLKRGLWEDGFAILRDARKRYPYPFKTVRARMAVIHYRLGEYDFRNGMTLRGLKHWLLSGMLDPLRAVSELRQRIVRR